MATVTGLTAVRMLEIESNSVVDGFIDGAGNLVLQTHGGDVIAAGYVKGPVGPTGPAGATGATGPSGPTAVSADVGNTAVLGSDGRIYVAATAYLSFATAWTAPTLQNSWANYGAPYQLAQYRKVGDEVQMRGLVRLGTVGSVICTLPVGFRPPAALLLAGTQSLPESWVSGAASAGTAHTHTTALQIANLALRLDVLTDGRIIPAHSTNGFIDLSLIRFSVTP